MREYTDITVLLDRSGSMSAIKEAMESAFDNFIKEHKSVPSTKITLVEFDDINDQKVVYQAVPVGAAEKLHLRPRGNTPLLDAFCKVIDNTGRRLADMPEKDRPDQVLMVVITDGQENASRKYHRSDVYDRVTRQREGYKWQFVYLGANQDVFHEAATFGIPHTHAMAYAHSKGGTLSGTRSMSVNTVSYANRSMGVVPDFNDTQRKEAEDKK